MSMDYGTYNGYGFQVSNVDYENLYRFAILNSPLIREDFGEHINNKILPVDVILDIWRNYAVEYESEKGISGVTGIINDVINYLYPDVPIEGVYDNEEGRYYILYCPDYFPNHTISQEEIDNIFNKVKKELNVD